MIVVMKMMVVVGIEIVGDGDIDSRKQERMVVIRETVLIVLLMVVMIMGR